MHRAPDWSQAARWTGDGLRREVFFFESGGVRLYGSLYAAAEPVRPVGVVVCPSWGNEADRGDRLAHGLACGMADLGGAGLVFDYPGYGDSEGDPAAVTMDALAVAASNACAAGAARFPDAAWIVAGLMFGASVACLGAARAAAGGLLLVQPSLSPSAYLDRVQGSARRSNLSGEIRERVAFGYALPRGLDEAGPELDASVAAALETFRGRGACVRYADTPKRDPDPEQLELVEAPGRWRFGAKAYPELAAAARGWLDRWTRDSEAVGSV
jgi:hypothetical protein